MDSTATTTITKQDVINQDPMILQSPKNPTPTQTIYLSNIDQAVSFPVEIVFFFQVSPSESSSTANISDTVKTAIADVLLVPYYFLAGRLKFNQDTNRLELLCNNAGAVFVAATSRLRIEDLGDLSLPNYSFCHLIHRPGLYRSLADTAIFTIQVTRFACGGFSLGFMTNHCALDGRASGEMMDNLASICRGESLKNITINNDRTLLKARNPPIILYPHNEYIKQGDKNSSLASSFTAPEELYPSPLIFSNKYTHKVFTFTPQMLNVLKHKAQCSSFEAIVGHVWRARTMAVFTDPDRMSTVLFAVDIRSRVSPKLPTGFAGNAVITAYATARVGDIVEKALPFCVEKIREGVYRVTDDFVRSAIDWLEVYRGIPATCNGDSFYVSAWWKLPFTELDLGYGKPVHGGPVVTGNDEFVVLMSDGKRTDSAVGIHVLIGLQHEKMKRLAVYMLDICS